MRSFLHKMVLLSLSFLIAGSVMAQNRSITGAVTSSDDGSPLPGVNVVVKGTTTGTVTDVDGNYRLNVSEGATLVFSFIGFTTQEIALGNQSVINVSLETEATQLGEVVVTGYGTALKKEFTGSSASISGDDVSQIPTMAVNQAIQGQAAGVFVGADSGTPGGGITVRVRGQTSISASNNPLYIIDGVPVISGDLSIQGFGGQETSALAAFNPQDIESIEVLKDAASTSIYGARAANGVVIITTKRGKKGGMQINYNGYFGTAQATNVNDILSAQEWVDIMNEARVNDGLAPRTNAEWGWDGVTSTNWIDEVFRTAQIWDHQLNLSGGSDNTQYFFSGSYRKEEGVMLGSGIERVTGRLNLDHQASDKLKFGTSISIANQINDRIDNDNNIGGVLSASLLGQPTLPVYTDETQTEFAPGGFGGFLANPVQQALIPRYDDTFLKIITNAYFSWEFVKGLQFRYDLSMDKNILREDHYEPASTRFGAAGNGNAVYNTRDVTLITSEPTLRYSGLFNSAHKVDAVLGLTYISQTDFRNSVNGQGFANESLSYIRSAANIVAGDALRTDYRFSSIFSRVSYSYNSKYLFSLSYRRDGSSRFGPDKRYGNFGAVSAGWIFSDEAFMDGVDWLSLGKIRTSYGIVGNDRIGNFQFLGTWASTDDDGNPVNYLGQSGTTVSTIANNDLQWEQTASLDVGLDLAFLDDRITFTTNYFNANTTELLYGAPLPETTGRSDVQANIGKINNTGWEFELGAVILPGEFRWSLDMNITFAKNEVVELLGDGEPIRSGFGSAIIEGRPLNSFFLWEVQKDANAPEGVLVNDTDLNGDGNIDFTERGGMLQIRDVNGDGVITADDQTWVGAYQPDFYGGIINRLSWKGLSLDFFFQFVEGAEIYNNTQQFSVHNGASAWGMERRALDRWTTPGQVTDVPRAATAATVNLNNDDTSRFLDDGSYIRLKNITLAYNLPFEVVNRVKLSSVRVFITGQNLWTSTNYRGFDPEVSTFGQTNTAGGTDFLTFPQAKMWTFGLNIGI